MVTRTPFNVTLYVHRLSCLMLQLVINVVTTGHYKVQTSLYSHYVILEARGPIMKSFWFQRGLAELVIFSLWLKSTICNLKYNKYHQTQLQALCNILFPTSYIFRPRRTIIRISIQHKKHKNIKFIFI
jgi:hypothetical protein